MSGAIQVWINDLAVGVLQDQQGLWSFQYQADWLQHAGAYALSPHLPLQAAAIVDGATKRPVQWYFDNLLPEEGQRTLLARDAQVDSADTLGLLAYYGAESAGSLVLVPVSSQHDLRTSPQGPMADASPGAHNALRPLTDAILSGRIRQLPKVPLTHGAGKRMSMAGAQHKLAVVWRDHALWEPCGAEPSTHLLKPDHPDPDYPHTVINEWFIMQLAARLGLQTPSVQRRYVPEPVYLIKRFDRLDLNGMATQRRHAIDACQLLGLDHSFKYAQGSVEALSQLAHACRSRASTQMRLYQWLVFNCLVGNGDAHLKNLSFLVSAQGIELAPYYDLLCTACYESIALDASGWPDQTRLAWPVLQAGRFAELTAATLLDAGETLGLSRTTARRVLTTLCTRIRHEAIQLYEIVEAQNAQLLLACPDLAATFAGEARLLRVVCYATITDMVKRLQH